MTRVNERDTFCMKGDEQPTQRCPDGHLPEGRGLGLGYRPEGWGPRERLTWVFGSMSPNLHKTDAVGKQRGIARSASALAAILVIFSLATAYMMFRLYRTSSDLAETNRKTFILDTKNKRAILEHYFERRVVEFVDLAANRIFETYFAAEAFNIPSSQGLEVIAAHLEQKLTFYGVDKEERGKLVYSRIAFYDIARDRITARTDNSLKGRWIDTALFKKLLSHPPAEVKIRSLCQPPVCRVFLIGPVTYQSQRRGLLLMELSLDTLQDQIQLLTLQRSDDFSGLVDSQGILILGPPEMIGRPTTTLFGITTSMLSVHHFLETSAGTEGEGETILTFTGGKITGTDFVLLRVAPRSRFVGSHLPVLWGLVFLSLMAALILVLLHIYRSYAERNVMYERLQDAHDNLEVRVKERTAELEEANRQLLLEISERKRAEEALRKASEELKVANRDLKDFAYVVSHDLKAPLRSVRQLVQWIVQDYATVLDETGKKYAELLTSRVDLMHGLIEGILKYSRVGRIREEKRDVDLNNLVQEVVSVISPPPSIEIRLVDPLPTLHCEPTLLHEVFQNLVDNAVKYMDKDGGDIRIGCRRENSHWLFSVADNGPGIDPTQFEKVFEIFKTLSPSEGVESTGIGLALVKKIVEQKGGRIWVESEEDSGATFHFTLPEGDREE